MHLYSCSFRLLKARVGIVGAAMAPGIPNCVRSLLYKTEFCRYYTTGTCCQGDSCNYAHTEFELRVRPDLSKTRLCPSFGEMRKCVDKDCTYAHSDRELRVTLGIFKTQLCLHDERGHCKRGDRCRHAHGMSDLRTYGPGVVPYKQCEGRFYYIV